MDDDQSRPQECMPLMITNTCFVSLKWREPMETIVQVLEHVIHVIVTILRA